ncbi:B-box zinc finger protein 21-like [Bidens hawaiensis]|uniref:B-box zinc finger protein 21-like n=1 Tax=Bidens hawaiensis TaxID=980011 RepID=UPI00404B25AE
MKIQCDVCNQSEALVYCSADEAALCSGCDHRVHHANKLAGKHLRFSLLVPKDTPVCDICQDKKAFLFCQQDRAILCKDCDLAIHKVNQHTLNHSRFLLTGVKVSPTSSVYSPPLTKDDGAADKQKKPVCSMIMNQTSVKTPCCHGSTTSSISEYLIETLPGWHVEDFLDPPPIFSKVGDKDPGSIWGEDLLDGSFNNSLSQESMGIWVPQAPPPPAAAPSPHTHVLPQFEPSSYMGFGDQTINGSSLSFAQNNYNNINNITTGTKSSRKWASDNENCFTVPQISPSSMTSKRSRTLWH